MNGHYQLAIPFKSDPPGLVDNRPMAEWRLRSLGKRLSKTPELQERYRKEIDNLLVRGFAEKVPDVELDAAPGRTWYLPHHCVFNPNKREKLRVVFGCAAKSQGKSLNDMVLQGPDLMNRLVGVLARFRKHPVGIMADVEAMFHQVQVEKQDRDALRFLWWPDGDTVQPPDVHRMTVHLFGGVWSPSCVNFALRRTADDNAENFNADVVTTVKENLYVDDCLKSLDSEDETIVMVKQLTDILAKGGFRLTKWISNSRRVIESVPPDERAKGIKNLDLDQEELPVERALGVHWDTEHDLLRMKIKSKQGSQTRRGLLSVICSVYDPLGFVCPYVLRAKLLFQNECRIVGKSWDDPLEAQTQEYWAKWLDELPLLNEFAVERCLVPSNFGEISECHLHHFSDASKDAYGSVSYARFVNVAGEVHCGFLMEKSRLAPLKTMTIPRLELSAAVVAVNMDQMLQRELKRNTCGSTFWTDSILVLQYIKNRSKRLHTFVANRVAVIHDGSSVDQWRYVNTDLNPADDASRGLDAHSMISKERWRKGPEFLWKGEESWPATPKPQELLETDREVKKVAVSRVTEASVTDVKEAVERLISKFSSWNRLKKAVAWILCYKKWLIERRSQSIWDDNRLTAAEMDDAEVAVIKYVQRTNYEQGMRDLEKGRRSVQRQSSIYSLEPIMDESGVLRLGGRLRQAPIEESRKFPAILPKRHHVSSLIVRHAHDTLSGHSGKEHVLSVVRQQFWIPKA